MNKLLLMGGLKTVKITPELFLDTTALGGLVEQREIRLTSA